MIDRSRSDVYQYLASLKSQDDWSPWSKRDPEMKKSFSGEDSTVGFISSWEGNKEVGAGEQEITKLVENELVQTRLRFFKPRKSESDAYLKVSDSEDGSTFVQWGFIGENKFPMSIMMLFMNMDKAIGKDFEDGLTSLKEVMES